MPLLPARPAALRTLLPLALLAVTLSLSGAGAAAPVHGPDVASYQHPGGAAIDWPAVQAGGSSFAVVKATEGTTYTNPYFSADWAAAGSAGLVRGAYHYARPSGSAAAQARAFVAVVGSTRERGSLAPVLDLEDDGGLAPADLVAWAHSFLDTVEQLTGRLPILYTYPSFWHTAMADNTGFGASPLWLASYRSTPPATLPGWAQWTLWQHTDAARLPGIGAAVDESYLCCGSGTLAALADGRTSAITALWRSLGGASGALGLPTGPEVPAPGGWAQPFQQGAVGYSPATGAHAVTGAIWTRWRTAGGAGGPLGLPVGDLARPTTSAQQQVFAGGVITSSTATGAHVLRGGYLARWRAEGGARGPGGLPTGERTARTGGSSQQFERAGFYAGTAGRSLGVHLVPGGIRDTYERLGGPASPLGLPVSDVQSVLGVRRVDFEAGSLVDTAVG